MLDCLRRLNRSGLGYMVTGSMASNFWGIPRTTHDLDFVIQIPPRSVPVLMHEFADGFFLDEQAVRAAYRPPHQFNAIDLNSELKVDFWLLKPVPFEREMFSRRRQVTYHSEPAWCATAEDTILHKLYWNSISPSDRQLGDVAGVVAVQGDALDRDYLRHWAKELGLETILAEALAGKWKPKHT